MLLEKAGSNKVNESGTVSQVICLNLYMLSRLILDMKRYIFLLLVVLAAALSCNRFDDSAIWDELNDHKERIEKLEEACTRLNANISAMQKILEALSQNDYVTDVMRIMEDGVEVGYSLTFAKGGAVTIYHGTNGTDGGTPKIGISKAADGEYYWTADGEWLTDEDLPYRRRKDLRIQECRIPPAICF